MALSWRRAVGLVLVFGFVMSGVFGDAGAVVQDASDDVEIARVNDLNLQLQKQVAELESRLSITDSYLKQARQESIDKSKKILSLENEVDTLQKRSSGDLKTKLQASEAKAEVSAKQVTRLEENVRKLEKTLKEVHNKLESAEARVDELSVKNENAEKTIANLRKKVRSAEEALKIAEVSFPGHLLSAHLNSVNWFKGLMLKAESVAAEKSQELYKVHSAWLPPWAATRVAQVMATTENYWIIHGKPFLVKTAEQASQHTSAAKDWASPHLDILKTKVGPAAKAYWEQGYEAFTTNSKLLGSRACEGYKIYLSPHVENAKQQVLPHVKVLKDKVRPLVDQAGVTIRPYYEQYAAPHVETLQGAYREGFDSVRSYHQHLEKSVRGLLLSHEAFAAWAASKELVTFLALAIVILPAVAMMLVVRSSFGGKKVKKPSRSHNSHKKHRRSKPTTAAAPEK